VNLLQVNEDGGLVVGGALNQGVIPASGPGIRLMWYPKKAAFRAGAVIGPEWDDANVGDGSVAMGRVTVASGSGATAIGSFTVADGPLSTAMGMRTVASGEAATAMGSETRAIGPRSTAMGDNTQAIGENSTAMGFRTTAAGNQSTVLGSNAQTFAAGVGSFVYGDAAGTTAISSVFPNEFLVRASGGFQFRTSPNLSTGCNLPAGSGTFDCTSSRLAKVDFEDVDGETVLGKLAAIRIQRWRYRGTDASHVGPTAEDFHAAFDVGQGPTTISTVDADGISLLAIQALERRTAELREENAALRAKLTEDTAALRTELEALRRIVETGRVAP
jgi:hypothetical protein